MPLDVSDPAHKKHDDLNGQKRSWLLELNNSLSLNKQRSKRNSISSATTGVFLSEIVHSEADNFGKQFSGWRSSFQAVIGNQKWKYSTCVINFSTLENQTCARPHKRILWQRKPLWVSTFILHAALALEHVFLLKSDASWMYVNGQFHSRKGDDFRHGKSRAKRLLRDEYGFAYGAVSTTYRMALVMQLRFETLVRADWKQVLLWTGSNIVKRR